MATGTRLNMPAGIDANATNLTVFAERGLDTAPFYAAFESGEIVKVTTGGPDTEDWAVERGALGTTRTAHQNGERLRIVITHEAAALVAAGGGGSSLPGVTSDDLGGIDVAGGIEAMKVSVRPAAVIAEQHTGTGSPLSLTMEDVNGSASGDYYLMQAFTPSSSFTVGVITIWAKANPALTADQLANMSLGVSVLNDNGGLPGGTTISGSVPLAGLSSAAFVPVSIAVSPGALVQGTQYWLSFDLFNQGSGSLAAALQIDAGGSPVTAYTSVDEFSTLQPLAGAAPARATFSVRAQGTVITPTAMDVWEGIVTLHNLLITRGSVQMFDTLIPMDSFNFLAINQTAPLTGDCNTLALNVIREGDLNGHDYQSPALHFHDTTASAQPLLTLMKELGTGELLRGRDAGGNPSSQLFRDGSMKLWGGQGEFGATPPASRPAITGTLTGATLAQLTSIVSQLLVALDAKGSITKSTT